MDRINSLLQYYVPIFKTVLEYIYNLNSSSVRDFEDINIVMDRNKNFHSIRNTDSETISLVLFYFVYTSSSEHFFKPSTFPINRARIIHESQTGKTVLMEKSENRELIIDSSDVINDYFALSTTVDNNLLDSVIIISEVHKALIPDMQNIDIVFHPEFINLVPKIYEKIK